jgi:hypothetical protein
MKPTRADGNAFHIEDEGRLFEFFEEMGLVEANADGDWGFSSAIDAGAILFAGDTLPTPGAPSAGVPPCAPRLLN